MTQGGTRDPCALWIHNAPNDTDRGQYGSTTHTEGWIGRGPGGVGPGADWFQDALQKPAVGIMVPQRPIDGGIGRIMVP